MLNFLSIFKKDQTIFVHTYKHYNADIIFFDEEEAREDFCEDFPFISKRQKIKISKFNKTRIKRYAKKHNQYNFQILKQKFNCLK